MREGLPVLSTYTIPSCSAMLLGVDPTGVCPTSVREVSGATANTEISSLAAFATRRWRPSPVSTTDPCDVRCGTPEPAPCVEYVAPRSSEPSAARRNATTLFCGSFV